MDDSWESELPQIENMSEDALYEMLGEEMGLPAAKNEEKKDTAAKAEEMIPYSTDSIMMAISALETNKPLAFQEAYELLVSIRHNDARVLEQIPIRGTASPLVPGLLNYIVCRRLNSARGVKRRSKRNGISSSSSASSSSSGNRISAIPVSFQSIQNSEIWWSSTGDGLGVSSRPMSLCTRSRTSRASLSDQQHAGINSRENKTQHGFRGRMYTLVQRLDDGSLRGALVSKNTKPRVVAVGDFGIVHTWPETEHDAASGASSSEKSRTKQNETRNPFSTKRSISTSDDESQEDQLHYEEDDDDDHNNEDEKYYLLYDERNENESIEAMPRKITQINKRARVTLEEEEDELKIEEGKNSELTFDRSLWIQGDVHVRGYIYGQLATAPRCQDYAEFFFYKPEILLYDDDLGIVESPPAGSVVQLRSPEQLLDLDTSGEGPYMIVSSQPSVAAGLPLDNHDSERGALVAFIGQVPVRCRGKVRCGDALYPSGLHDGTAVSVNNSSWWKKLKTKPPRLIDPIGIALEDAFFDDDNSLKKKSLAEYMDLELQPLSSGNAQDNSINSTSSSNPLNKNECCIMCMVRWNNAVRREIRDEMDKVKVDFHSTATSVLVYCTALFSSGVTALLSVLIIYTIKDLVDDGKHDGNTDNSLSRHRNRICKAVSLLAAFNLCLFFGVAALFTDQLPHNKIIAVLFAIQVIILAVYIISFNNRQTILVIQINALLFHSLLAHSALQLRKYQIRPKSILTTPFCSPRIANAIKLVAPLLFICLLFILVFFI